MYIARLSGTYQLSFGKHLREAYGLTPGMLFKQYIEDGRLVLELLPEEEFNAFAGREGLESSMGC